jgi:hypothetical protein
MKLQAGQALVSDATCGSLTWDWTEMWLWRAGAILVLCLTSPTDGRSQSQQGTKGGNTAPLRGGAPMMWNILPSLPPTGFHAWCNTGRGLCPVQGNAPIAPGSACHCADQAGRTM